MDPATSRQEDGSIDSTESGHSEETGKSGQNSGRSEETTDSGEPVSGTWAHNKKLSSAPIKGMLVEARDHLQTLLSAKKAELSKMLEARGKLKRG
jgi:hypothetical protein